MASITSTITLIDRMTPVLDNIINGMQTTINMLDRTDAAIDKAFDPSQIYQAKTAYGTAHAQLCEIEEQLQRNTQRQEEFNDEIIQGTKNADGLLNKIKGAAGAYLGIQGLNKLTQAMASGRFQGDEYRSIIENAPLLANSIEDYMRNVQKAKGTMKDWASDGLLTADVIKAAMFSSADDVEQRFKNMPVAWVEVWTMATNKLQRTFKPVLNFISMLAGNWSILEPVVIGMATAVNLYDYAMKICAIVQKLANIQAFIQARALLSNINLQAVAINTQYALAVATAQATVAQSSFNTALLACPITWIILAVIALVALLYTVVAVINKVKGTSISATGVIVGGLNVVLQFIWNLAKTIVTVSYTHLTLPTTERV